MSKVNFTAIKEHVSTHYGDLTGVIQVDGHDNVVSIYELCKDHEFSSMVTCSILYVNKSEYGENFEEIDAKIRNTGVLSLKRKNISVKYSTIGKYIKGYSFMLLSNLGKNIISIELPEKESDS